MESRLRKLLSLKKSRGQPLVANSELDLHSVPYTTVQPQGRFPVLLSHALGRPATAKRKDDKSNGIHSFSYNATVPGTPPELGDRPQRGNGPVKLQTSRRLSSGELLVTQQDYDRTLEDIRHGEYIVAGKQRRASRPPPVVAVARPQQPMFISTAPNSPGAQSTFSSSVWSPASDIPVSGSFTPRSLSATTIANQPRINSSSTTDARFQDLEDALTSRNSLAQSNLAHRFAPNHMASTTSLVGPNEERTPTIQALWKAEYSRLESIYGQPVVDQYSPDVHPHPSSMANLRLTQHMPNHRESNPSGSPTLHTISHPHVDLERRGLPIRHDPSASHLELDHSDSSSNIRYSLLSSSGASSSFTARTSIAEESTTTREDVRRIVDDMRMNYLNALEAHTPPLQPLPDLPSQRPRSKKTRSLVSSTSVESGLRSVNRQSGSRTKSWQSTASSQQSVTPRTSTSSPPTRHQNKRKSSGTSRRVSGPPVAGISSLPAIEASPAKSTPDARQKREDTGLKRADSTTLGSMEKMLTIIGDKKPNATIHTHTTPSPSTFVPSDAELRTTSLPNVAASSSSPILETPPRRNPSIQSTPAKYESLKSVAGPAAAPTWHLEAARLFADADVDVSLDVDDFEALCDDLFSTPAAGKPGAGKLDTWGQLPPAANSAERNKHIATGSPRKRAHTTTGAAVRPLPLPAGLGLSLLATSG